MEDMNVSSTNHTFSEGSQVVYGLHGRCKIMAIEKKKVGGETIEFYKLEKERFGIPNPKADKKKPFILLPVTSAKRQGLRPLIDDSQCDEIWGILNSREYYLSLDEKWNIAYKKLESLIQEEGAIGLAKAASYLYVLVDKKVVPASDLTKFNEMVMKLLARELSEFHDEQLKTIEEKMEEALKNKLKPDV